MATAAALQQRTMLFYDLPLELRELIYQYIVPLPSSDIFFTPRLCISAADVISGSDPNFPHWLPPISRVSSGTRVDVALYILRQVEIYVSYHQTLQNLHRFLGTLPATQGQGAIRKLNFPSFGAARFEKCWETAYIDFAKSCTQLATLQVGINAPDLRMQCELATQLHDRYSDVMLDPNSIVEAYRLKELLGIPSLVSISFELCPLFNGKPVSGVVAVVKKVAVLLRMMFAAQDKQVDLLVIDFRGNEWIESV